MATVQLSATGWLGFAGTVHVGSVVALSATGTLAPYGASGSHGGVSSPQLSAHGTLSVVGRVVAPFRPPSDVRYTKEATPGIVER